MQIVNCRKCGEQQYSLMDRAYLQLFDTCWSEDKKRWDNGELSLEEFEKRETIALQDTL